MSKKSGESPRDYDRWGKVGITLINDAPKKETKTPKKVVRTAKKGK